MILAFVLTAAVVLGLVGGYVFGWVFHRYGYGLAARDEKNAARIAAPAPHPATSPRHPGSP